MGRIVPRPTAGTAPVRTASLSEPESRTGQSSGSLKLAVRKPLSRSDRRYGVFFGAVSSTSLPITSSSCVPVFGAARISWSQLLM